MLTMKAEVMFGSEMHPRYVNAVRLTLQSEEGEEILLTRNMLCGPDAAAL